jgi:exopolysaccharide biosynthesis polyprenyl glycosylphosphotransferase
VALLGHRGWLIESALIVGAGRVGVELARVLMEHPRYGLRPVGFVDDFGPGETLPIPLLGGVRQLDSVLEAYEIRRVLIAFGATREPDMVPIIRACDRASIDIHVLPRFFELGHGVGRDVDVVWGFPLRRLRRAALRPRGCYAKRTFDVVVAALLISLLLPLYAVAAVAVRLSGRGAILFRQKRVGSRGRVFEVLKFRTLPLNDDSDTRWSVTDDQRITAVGRILRRTCIDELPQLFNVLRGDMSIVGPRPERPFFVSRFTIEVPRYDDRHRMQVGLTGWAQIHGLRGDTSVAHRARFDNDYIENWSLWLDVVILARTAVEILRSCLRRSN